MRELKTFEKKLTFYFLTFNFLFLSYSVKLSYLHRARNSPYMPKRRNERRGTEFYGIPLPKRWNEISLKMTKIRNGMIFFQIHVLN